MLSRHSFLVEKRFPRYKNNRNSRAQSVRSGNVLRIHSREFLRAEISDVFSRRRTTAPSADSCIYLTLPAPAAPSANPINRLVPLLRSSLLLLSLLVVRLSAVSLRIFLSFPIAGTTHVINQPYSTWWVQKPLR